MQKVRLRLPDLRQRANALGMHKEVKQKGIDACSAVFSRTAPHLRHPALRHACLDTLQQTLPTVLSGHRRLLNNSKARQRQRQKVAANPRDPAAQVISSTESRCTSSP